MNNQRKIFIIQPVSKSFLQDLKIVSEPGPSSSKLQQKEMKEVQSEVIKLYFLTHNSGSLIVSLIKHVNYYGLFKCFKGNKYLQESCTILLNFYCIDISNSFRLVYNSQFTVKRLLVSLIL